MKNVLLIFAVLGAVALMGTNQNGECDELKKENEKLKQELISSLELAKASQAEAEHQRVIAEQTRKAADEAHQMAKKAADAANMEAQRQAALARKNAELAVVNAAEAEKQRKLAEECAKKN